MYRLKYQTIVFDQTDIHVRTLRDVQQFHDQDGVAEKLGISSASWPHFGVIWDAGHVLAEHMRDLDVEGKRILEVGCGIGLPSLLLNHQGQDISATDRHPEAEAFMIANTQLNDDRTIPFVRTGWTDPESCLGKFDLIIGSDLLYEAEHVGQLAFFVEQHANPSAEVIITDQGRGLHAKFTTAMIALGFSHSQEKPEATDYLATPFPGQVISYQRAVD